MTTYAIAYRQTWYERYNTDINDLAEALFIELGMEVVGYDGGCWMDPFGALPAESYFLVEDTTLEALRAARTALEGILGHPETLVIEVDGQIGVCVA